MRRNKMKREGKEETDEEEVGDRQKWSGDGRRRGWGLAGGGGTLFL